MRLLVTAFLLFCLLPSSAAAAEPLSVRGVSIGVNLADFRQLHPQAECVPGDGLLSDRQCVLSGYGGDADAIVIVYFYVDAVSQITVVLDEADYRAIAAAMVLKFGSPDNKETSFVSNAMGAKFPSEHMAWVTAETGATMTIDQRVRKVDQSQVQLVSAATLQEFGRRSAVKRKATASQL